AVRGGAERSLGGRRRSARQMAGRAGAALLRATRPRRRGAAGMTVTSTIADRLVERAGRAPSDVLITLVDDGGQDEGWLTAAGVHEAGRRVAADLPLAGGLQPGAPGILACPSSL